VDVIDLRYTIIVAIALASLAAFVFLPSARPLYYVTAPIGIGVIAYAWWWARNYLRSWP
jgi:hypothetical protein